MKTAAKIFIILSIIGGFWLIFPLVLGILSIKKLNTATSKDELTTLGILTLIFCSLIGGILMLCITDKDLEENKPKVEKTTGEQA